MFMEEPMTRSLALSTLAMVCALSASPPASAQTMKEGTTGGTYYGHGTAKVTPVGKERLLITFEDNGPSVGQGIIDHLTVPIRLTQTPPRASVGRHGGHGHPPARRSGFSPVAS